MKPGVMFAWMLTAVVVLVSWGVHGQDAVSEVYPGDRIAWDPGDAASVKRTTHYEFRHTEATPWRSVGLIREWPIPNAPPGEYVLQIRACRRTSCSDPASLRVRILPPNVPRMPGNFLVKCRP